MNEYTYNNTSSAISNQFMNRLWVFYSLLEIDHNYENAGRWRYCIVVTCLQITVPSTPSSRVKFKNRERK